MGDHIDDELLHGIFSGTEWCEAADAVFEVSGAVIAVTLPADGGALYASSRCAYCELLHPSGDVGGAGGWGCVGQIEELSAGKTMCFSGLPCLVGEVRYRGRTIAFITVSGFISATRERRLLSERLANAGVVPGAVCKAVREIPVVPRRRVEATLKVLCTHAESLVARTCEARSSGRRLQELEIFLDAGREFLELDPRGGELEQRIIDRAVCIVGGTSGVLGMVRPGTDLIDIAATAGVLRDPAPGDALHIGDVLEGRVISTGKSVVISGVSAEGGSPEGDGPATIVVCLRGSGGRLGSITVHGVASRGLARSDAMRFLERFATVAATVLENTRSGHATRRALDELVYVSRSAKSLAACSTCDEVTAEATAAIDEMFDAQVCGVALSAWGYDSVYTSVRGSVRRGVFSEILAEAAGRDVVREPFASVRFSDTGGTIIDDDAHGSGSDDPVLSVPLTVGGLVVGYAFAALPAAGRFFGADERALHEMGEHIASALGRASEWERLRQEQADTIAALAAALDSAERAEPGHTDRIVGYALALGRELGLPAEDLHTLRFAAVVHDIGAVGITPGVLGKTDRLTPAEMDEVRRHPVIGADIVSQLKHLDAVTPAVKHHHERWDGTGYPLGLGGTEIPLLARVLAVADAFDAMTSSRPHQTEMSVAEARRELQHGAGTQFDPEAVTAFLAFLDRQVLAGVTGLLAGQTGERESRLPA